MSIGTLGRLYERAGVFGSLAQESQGTCEIQHTDNRRTLLQWQEVGML